MPYDWAGFFKQRIATIQPRAPLRGITGAGYRLTYTDQEPAIEKARDDQAKQIDERFSLGLIVSTDAKSDGRGWSADRLRAALGNHKGVSTALELIVADGDFFKTVHIDAHEGLRYPHLVRDASQPDELQKIYAPRTPTSFEKARSTS